MMTSEGKTMFMFTVVWRGSRRTLLLAVGLVTALVLSSAFAQESAVAWRTVPNALLSIDLSIPAVNGHQQQRGARVRSAASRCRRRMHSARGRSD